MIDDISSKKLFELEKFSLKEIFSIILQGYKKYGEAPVEILEKAFVFGKNIHKNQKRDSGVEYFTHPLLVACLLLKYEPDISTLVAAILHDVFEDSEEKTQLVKVQVNNMFGQDIYNLIEGVSKIPEKCEIAEIHHRNYKDVQLSLETIRKLLLFAEKDVRILFIKLVDRMHNILTISTKKGKEKRERKVIETKEVYVPIASKLGLWDIKDILESYCFENLYLDEYVDLKNQVNHYKKKSIELFEKINKFLLDNIYSISHFKVEKYVYDPSQLYTRKNTPYLHVRYPFHVNIICQSVKDCYQFISEVSNKNKFIITKTNVIKNYIVVPKFNGYQAIHMTMIVDGRYSIRFHVMTEKMFKENNAGMKLIDLQTTYKDILFSDFELIENATKSQSYKFMEAVKKHMLADKIIIHNPEKGEFYIPENLTALDAVFHLFPKKARFVKDIFVNHIKVNFDYIILNNDIVEIIFSKKTTFDIKYLQILNSEVAKFRIQKFLKKKTSEYKVDLGKNFLQQYLDKLYLGDVDSCLRKNMLILQTFRVDSIDELFILIGEGIISPLEIVDKIKKEKNNISRIRKILFGEMKFSSKFFLLVKKIFPSLNFKKKEKKGRLRIRIQSQKNINMNLFDVVNKYAKENKTLIQEADIYYRQQQHYGDFLLKSSDKKDLYNCFLNIQKDSLVSNISATISRIFVAKIFFLLIAVLASWFAVSYYVFYLKNISWHIYLLLIVPLFMNTFIYYVFSHYFTFFRKSRFVLIFILLVNLFGIGLLSRFAIYSEVSFSIQFIVLALFLFIFSSLSLSYVYLRRHKLHIEIPSKAINVSLIKRKKQKTLGYLFRFGAVLIWGIYPLYMKYTPMSAVTPSLRLFLICLGALGISLLLYFTFGKITKQKLSIRSLNYYFFLIVGGALLFNYLSNISLTYTSSTNHILINNFAPIIALMIAAFLWRKEIPYLKKMNNIIYIFLIFIMGSLGGVLLFYNDIQYASDLVLYGNLLLILVMLSDVMVVIGEIKAVSTSKKNISSVLNVYVYTAMTLISLPFLFTNNIFEPSNIEIIYSLGAGVLLGIGTFLNYEAFRRIDGFLAFLMFNIATFITVIVEAFVLNKIVLTPFIIIGGVMIIGASLLAEVVNSRCEKDGL